MHTLDEDKTSFITNKGLYCYKVMSFDLKNVGATYQRLVNKLFKKKIGKTIEIYVNDMITKSVRSTDHVADLKNTFEILRKQGMKLNPDKCAFGVSKNSLALWYIK